MEDIPGAGPSRIPSDPGDDSNLLLAFVPAVVVLVLVGVFVL
ncbi:hypothetical protein [Halogeometricum salsisoli]|nr:hypothetical protein [Halogeometricum sp. S1BR25-6]